MQGGGDEPPHYRLTDCSVRSCWSWVPTPHAGVFSQIEGG